MVAGRAPKEGPPTCTLEPDQTFVVSVPGAPLAAKFPRGYLERTSDLVGSRDPDEAHTVALTHLIGGVPRAAVMCCESGT